MSPGEILRKLPDTVRRGVLIMLVVGMGLLTLPDIVGIRRVAREDDPPQAQTSAGQEQDHAARLARQLEDILSRVQGAGRVSVQIFLGSDSVVTYATNTTRSRTDREEATEAGLRSRLLEESTQSTVVLLRGPGGDERPLVTAVQYPEVMGVLVVAQGAGDSRVKEELIRAVQAALGVPPHRVRVMRGGGSPR